MTESALSAVLTCSAFPVQFEGECCGVPFYYRARWGRWAIQEINVNTCSTDEFLACIPVAGGELEGGAFDTGTIADALTRIAEWAAPLLNGDR